ncbi:MAG: hypothetical protein M0R21_01840 [Lentimicrobiaceae bacterium]|nr:hypothetical protein [Lentimicrobiaceae bacterium]
MKTPVITQFCSINHSTVFVNGEPVFSFAENDFTAFMKAAYKNSGAEYMKFYKMDGLCKLAFITSEYLLKGPCPVKLSNPEKTAVVINNGSSSMQSDVNHQYSINDAQKYFPSPAVFVYTLPNIMIGEICIRHAIKGENALFISKEMDTGLLHNYITYLFNNKRVDSCIAGWVEQNENLYESFLLLIQKNYSDFSDNHFTFTIENLKKIYKQESN